MMEKWIGISETMVSASKKSNYLSKLEIGRKKKIGSRVKKSKKQPHIPFPSARASVRKHR